MKRAGFTLIELLVVIAIISILAGVILANLGEGSAQSRDAERQADLRNLETALELYKLKNGRYPERCTNANPSAAGGWSGQTGTNFACSAGSQYIKGDLSTTPEVEVFAPEFIPVLPIDPKLNGTNSGYVYTVNDDGTVYKLMAFNTVESELVLPEDEFSRCGNVNDTKNECSSVNTSPRDTGAYNSGGATPLLCQLGGNNDYQNDYAVSAGYARGGNDGTGYLNTEKAKEFFTDQIRCK